MHRFTDLENKLMVVGGGEGWGESIVRVWYGHIHTAICEMDNEQGTTV